MLVATSWPEAAIAITTIGFIALIIGVLIWQIFSTGRTAIRRDNAEGYRKLTEELAEAQRATTEQLQQANEALAQLREQTRELELGLRELDRVLKTVE